MRVRRWIWSREPERVIRPLVRLLYSAGGCQGRPPNRGSSALIKRLRAGPLLRPTDSSQFAVKVRRQLHWFLYGEPSLWLGIGGSRVALTPVRFRLVVPVAATN